MGLISSTRVESEEHLDAILNLMLISYKDLGLGTTPETGVSLCITQVPARYEIRDSGNSGIKRLFNAKSLELN